MQEKIASLYETFSSLRPLSLKYEVLFLNRQQTVNDDINSTRGTSIMIGYLNNQKMFTNLIYLYLRFITLKQTRD